MYTFDFNEFNIKIYFGKEIHFLKLAINLFDKYIGRLLLCLNEQRNFEIIVICSHR